MMPRFSANLGFLWSELDLPDAVRAAAKAGFDAVECHWPYDTAALDLKNALRDAGLPLLGLNTRPGDMAKAEFGLSALPGEQIRAREAIDEAVDYADQVGAEAIHVMAGKAEGAEAESAFLENLAYACARAGARTVLIEPINPYDVPGYFLQTTDHACQIIEKLGAQNLKLMFDCYHVARVEGAVLDRLKALLPVIGHIQFASVPDRAAPDHGDLDYAAVFDKIDALGWTRPIGAEYRPQGATDASLNWMTGQRPRESDKSV